MAKIVNELVLNEAIKQLGQLIADNSCDFVPYTDDEISDLFSLTPEEVAHLTDLIADTVVSQYKLWSSKKVNDELTNAKSECNDYTDSMLSNISSITIDYVEQLPVIGDSSTIYILKATDSSAKDTLNLYKDGCWINIGDFEVDLTQYYDKTEIDQLLLAKADNSEVLKQDDVIVDTSLATTTTVLSATTTIEELNKKANDDEVVKKTDIVTTIDSTSTDDTVPSTKAVNDKFDTLSNRIQPSAVIFKKANTSYSTLRELIQNHEFFKSSTAEEFIFGAEGFDDLPVTNWGFSIRLYTRAGNKHIIAYKMLSSDLFYTRSMDYNGTWVSDWKKLCVTSVADVSVTSLTWADTTYFENSFTGCNYQVKNGVCFVNIDMICNSPMNGGYKLPITLPTPNTDYVHSSVSSLPNGSYGHSSITIAVTSGGTHVVAYGGIAGDRYLGIFSYPVAES